VKSHLVLAAGLALASSGCAGAAKATEPTAEPPKALSPPMGDRGPRGPEAPITAPPAAPKGVVAITHATLLLGTGARIEDGTIVLEGDRIAAVGKAAAVAVPKGATVVDGRGRFVTPGIIDTHSHMGVYAAPHVNATADGNEMTDPTTPYVFSEHAFWPQDPAIRHAVAGGVTTIQVLPGSGNIIGGRATTLRLNPRLEARAMRFPGAPFGLKMACGENPKRVYGEKHAQPMSRMGSIAKLRAAFIQAQQYAYDQAAFDAEYTEWKQKYDDFAAKKAGAKDPGKEPHRGDRNLGLETLADVLAGKIKVHVHCYRADEMIQVLELSEEFGFKVRSFHHAVEAYKIRTCSRPGGERVHLGRLVGLQDGGATTPSWRTRR
jgi:imidazolonepropionase-like amidohydrolase